MPKATAAARPVKAAVVKPTSPSVPAPTAAAPPQLPQATGYPAQREFATFRELNMGQVRLTGKRTGHVDFSRQGDSYESFRRVTNSARENLW